jgi:hypothetical protein
MFWTAWMKEQLAQMNDWNEWTNWIDGHWTTWMNEQLERRLASLYDHLTGSASVTFRVSTVSASKKPGCESYSWNDYSSSDESKSLASKFCQIKNKIEIWQAASKGISMTLIDFKSYWGYDWAF